MLLAAAAAALVWANAAPGAYGEFWSTEISARVGTFEVALTAREVVNDLLMVTFFYVVALEVKREMLHGDLRDRRTAALPVAAAIGTMLGAAAAYLIVNVDGGEPAGWAIPIATDIAFAMAALGVVHKRAPSQLRTFFLTLAVVDDFVTILVIAVLFAEDLSPAWLLAAVAIPAAIVVLQRLEVRAMAVYVVSAAALWLALLEGGVHPTLAGVILGFLTPAAAFYPRQATGRSIADQLAPIRRNADAEFSQATMWEVGRLAREAVGPLARMEEQLHPWSAYVVLPIFALANAGVAVAPDRLADALGSPVGLGIAAGLLVGAPLGGIVFVVLAIRIGVARLPDRLSVAAIATSAPLKGIGFTVAIFLATLVFPAGPQREEAIAAILVASVAAGLLGVGLLDLRARLATRPG